MFGRRANLPLLAAFAVSALLHLTLLVPAMVRMMSVPHDAPAQLARLEAHNLLPPVEKPREEDEDEVDLGIDALTPSSLTWIGYEQYQMHLAQLAEVEQAAFTNDPIAASPPPVSAASAAPADELQEPVPQSPQPITESMPDTSLAAQADQHHDAEPASSSPPPSPPSQETGGRELIALGSWLESIGIEPQIESSPAPLQPPPRRRAPEPPESPKFSESPESEPEMATDISPEQAIERLLKAITTATTAAASEQSRDDDDSADSATPASTPPTTSATPPVPESSQPEQPVARQPTSGTDVAADQSDRDSDPSSTVDVPREQWQLGRPLAAHGLELKTVRPQFTMLTLLTASPGNPVCEIHIDRHGIPKLVKLLRGSGDRRVDDAMIASLYRWRAAGKRLEALREDETVVVRMKLILNPRVRD